MLSILDVSRPVREGSRPALTRALAGSVALHAAALATLGSLSIGVTAPVLAERSPTARRPSSMPIVFVATGGATTASRDGAARFHHPLIHARARQLPNRRR